MTTNRTRNFIFGVGTSIMVQIATIFVGLFLTPITLRYLDSERYGVFTLASDLLGWLALIDLGVTAALVSHASQLNHQKDKERLNRLASTAAFSQIGVALVALLIGVAGCLCFGSFFNISPANRQEAFSALVLLTIGTSIQLGARTFSAILISAQQVHVDNAIRTIMIVVRAVLTYVLLRQGYGLLALALANLAATLFTVVLWVVRSYRMLPGLRLRRAYVSRETFREITGLGLWFCLGLLANLLILGMDRIVTARVLGVTFVSTLVLTGRLYFMASGVLQQLCNTSQPMIGQLLGQNQHERARQVSRQLFVLSASLAVVFGASLWSGNQTFVTRWVGAAFYGGWGLDLAIAFNMLVYAWVQSNRVVLTAAKIAKPVTISRLAEGILNLTLSVILARVFGLIGVILGTTVAALITSTWAVPREAAKLFGISLKQVLWDDAKPVLALLLALCPVAYGIKLVAQSVHGYPGALIGFCGTALCGVVLMWWVTMDEPLRLRARTLVLRFANRNA